MSRFEGVDGIDGVFEKALAASMRDDEKRRRAPKLEQQLFIGDNGRIFCAAHMGATARATGRDLSGQPVHPVNDDDRVCWLDMMGKPMACECCTKASQ